MLKVINVNSEEWKAQARLDRERFEIIAADILNRDFKDWEKKMEEVLYYCSKCTARKLAGWKCCPFCCHTEHYHNDLNQGKIEGSGLVRPHKAHVVYASEPMQGQSQSQSQMHGQSSESLGLGERVSSEEEQFNSSVKTIRSSFDNLKRCRKARTRIEQDLISKVSQVQYLEKTISQMQDNMKFMQTPQPFAIRSVFGQKEGSDLKIALGIISIGQGYPNTDITVRLP